MFVVDFKEKEWGIRMNKRMPHEITNSFHANLIFHLLGFSFPLIPQISISTMRLEMKQVIASKGKKKYPKSKYIRYVLWRNFKVTKT